MSARRRKSLLATLVWWAGLPTAWGQTSGTWAVDVGTTGGSWSVASNWVNGVIPDNGGTATFPVLPFSTAPLLIVQDLPTVSLGEMNFQTLITYRFTAPVSSPGNSITLTGDAVLNTPIASINSLGITFFGQLLQLPIAGTSGLTKRGPGTVTLWQHANPYTGGTRVEEGVLVLRQIGDAALGNPAGSLTLDGGTVRVTTLPWNSSRDIRLGPAGGTFEATATGTITLNGPISGPGGMNKIGVRGLSLTNNNSFAGPTQILAGSIGLSGNGVLSATSAVLSRERIVLDNTGMNLLNRVSDAASLTLFGSTLDFLGSPGAASSEVLGQTTFSRGATVVTITPGTGQSASISMQSGLRERGAILICRGTSLGEAPGPNVANLTFATPPALVGGGGTTSTNKSIVPWAFGVASITEPQTALGLLTYGPNGLRPLAPATEYTPSLATAAAADNVRVTADQSLSSPRTINALVVAGGSSIAGPGTLSITSGALLVTTGSLNLSAPVDFGSAEGIVVSIGNTTLSGPISGSGGLNKQGAGFATFAATSTYTGITTLGAGTSFYAAQVPKGAPSPFGSDNSAIVLAPGGIGTAGNTARLVYNGAGSVAFDRDLLVSGRVAVGNAAILPGFGLNGPGTLTMNGDITLDASPMTFLSNNPAAVLVINGDISGTGPVTDGSATAGTVRLNGNNTFTEGTELGGGLVWQVGSDTAFGDGGLIKIVGTGSARIEAIGGPRSIANPVVCFSSSTNYWTIAGNEPITFTGSINLSGAFSHNISNTALTTYAGTLHTGGFTKAGPGTLVLSGDNLYTGLTTVASGTLRITHGNALGSELSRTIVNAGAQLELAGARTREPLTINGNGPFNTGAIHVSAGGNTLGDVTVAGNSRIVVQAGSLAVGNLDASTPT
ncbi:MAG: autotransporter-associated beta strand repeat-containing protein, partial [Phycisphaerae bacterium]|nr:autotransporter-associated beta strand repeat-containing protein [Phycisphaerae bacterium]